MYYIGIDVGGTNLVAGLVNEAGRILDKVNHPVDKAMSAEELCLDLARMSKKLCEMGSVDFSQIEAVGVGLPGLVDNGAGVVVQTVNMAFDNTPAGDLPAGVGRARLSGQRRQLRRRRRVLGRGGQGL